MSIPATLVSPLFFILVVLLSPPQTRGRRHTIEVHNHTDSAVERIYVSATTEDGWGDDRLGDGTLRAHYYSSVTVLTGDYDFKVVSSKAIKPCIVLEQTIFEDTKLEVVENAARTELKCRIDKTID